MLVVAFFFLCALSVPLAGGRLMKLAKLRLRAVWSLALAAGIQVALAVAPAGAPLLHGVAHVGSYVLAGWFVVANRHIPGLWLTGFGGALNLVAIAANHGMMPVLPEAANAAGLESVRGVFHNAAVVAAPHLP